MTRPVVTHVTAPLSQRALWLSLLIPYADPFMGDRYVAWPDTAPRTVSPRRFRFEKARSGYWMTGVSRGPSGPNSWS